MIDRINIKQCRHGRLMWPTNDVYIGRSLQEYGEYSEDEINLWKQFIKPGMHVIDAGANIGCFTIWMAKAVGPKGTVFAFEPQRQIFQMLVGNLALNELQNVHTMMGALGDRNGMIEIPQLNLAKPNNYGGVTIGDPAFENDPKESVPIVTLDSMQLQALDFIKIDVEGMEKTVLDGGKQTIENLKPIMYIENDRPEKCDELITTLLEMKYRMWWHEIPLYNMKNFFNNTTNYFTTLHSANMLCIHKSKNITINGLREIKSITDKSIVKHRSEINV